MIDNSASMSATDVQPNRLEWAKAEAMKEIDAATDADFGMVIVFNSTAEIRQSYTSNRILLRKAVTDIEPTNNPTQVDEALNLAASLANPLFSTEDAAVRPANPEPGKERTYAQRGRDPGRRASLLGWSICRREQFRSCQPANDLSLAGIKGSGQCG